MILIQMNCNPEDFKTNALKFGAFLNKCTTIRRILKQMDRNPEHFKTNALQSGGF